VTMGPELTTEMVTLPVEGSPWAMTPRVPHSPVFRHLGGGEAERLPGMPPKFGTPCMRKDSLDQAAVLLREPVNSKGEWGPHTNWHNKT
jgi:hypothetical protein